MEDKSILVKTAFEHLLMSALQEGRWHWRVTKIKEAKKLLLSIWRFGFQISK